MHWYDIIGLFGVFFLLLAYFLLQIGQIKNNLYYSLLNILGSSLILFSLYFKFNLSAALIEVFWILISLIGVYNYLKTRNDGKK